MVVIGKKLEKGLLPLAEANGESYRKARRAVAESLLRRALVEMNRPISDICIGMSDTGKPFMTNRPTDFFNFSYTRDAVICAVGDAELGADIEQIRAVNLKDYREYLSTTEYYQLAALPATEQILHFFELWTLKESYLKMTGEGLSGLHHDLSMQFSEGRWWLWENGVRNKEVYLQLYYPTPNHVVAICSHEPPPENIIWVD